jgi:excinuclease ABC subunit C
MLDADGVLIYVGKAKLLRARLLSYFRPHSRDPKAGRILEHARAIVWEPGASEFAALLRELELIRRWRPRFNVVGQPQRQGRTFVCLGRKPAPYVFLARRPPAGAAGCFGPVPAGSRAREAVRRLNDWYRLRDCPQAQEMIFADQAELFPQIRAAGCIRHEIGTCLAPCAGACSWATYRVQVRAACAFLAGTDPSPLQTLEQAMAAAAQALDYEGAAAFRDRLEALLWLWDHLDRLRTARRQHSFIYTVPGFAGRNFWYLLHQGLVRAAVPAPETLRSRRAAAAAIKAVYEERRRAREEPSVAEVEAVFLVASWFRRYPQELARTWLPADALARTL